MPSKKRAERRVSSEKQIYDLKQLLEVSKSLNSTMDLPALIEALLYICMGQFQITGAALFTKPDFDSTSFKLSQNFYGLDVKEDADYSIPEGHPLVAALSKWQGGTTVAQLLEDGLEADETVEAISSLCPSLVAPLKARGKVNGIILLGEQISEESYSAYDMEILDSVAALAAIAINNAQLLDMSTTDIMTHLKLKHFFYATLAERMEEAENKGVSLSVIMLDIDFFKRFNDTHGHECGDFVLKKVAEAIQKSTRAQDLAARYGGEEFVVMLFETGIAMAEKIAERIRASVEDMELFYRGKSLSVTISAGVAQYDPSADTSAKDLVDRADKALYSSKREGRNRVTAAFIAEGAAETLL